MKTYLMNSLFIPVWIALLASVACWYWYFKYDVQVQIQENGYLEFEAKIKALECSAVDKDVVLTTTRRSIDQGHDFVEMYRHGAEIFLVLGVLNFYFSFTHVRKIKKMSTVSET